MKKNLIILTLITTVLFTFGCSQKSAGSYGSQPIPMRELAASYDAVDLNNDHVLFRNTANLHFEMRDDSGSSESAILGNQEQKLVKRASVRIRVENLEAADAAITGLLRTYGGYAASTNIEESSRSYSLRVPAQYYDIFLSDMNGMGRLVRRSESTEDVTLRYYDLEGRLATKRELLKTFQSYLGRANSIDEILAVEARIADLQYDIEGTGIQLRNLANRVDYANIDLTLLGPATASSYKSETVGERLKKLFLSFGGFLSTTLVVFIGIIIFGVPIILLLCLLFWLLFGRVGLLKKLWRVIRK